MNVEIITADDVLDFNSVEAAQKYTADIDHNSYKIRVVSPKGYSCVFSGLNGWAEFVDMTGYKAH